MSNTGFTPAEKRRFLMRKYIREHIFDFVLGLVCNCLYVVLIVFLCGGTRYLLGVLLAVVGTIIRAAYSLSWYRKDYLNVDIPKTN